MRIRHAFSKVLSIVPLYRKCTRALTFQNVCSGHHHEMTTAVLHKWAEPIFIKYRVDVVFAGHVHAYERNAGVECGEASATGPMYITLGNGGNHEGLYDDWLPKPEYRYV